MNKLVYVEDEPEVGELIAAYLGKHDFDVVVETRGDRAEETIISEQPDLVMLDIMLPGKDGMTLCRDLRTRWNGPIVLLTSLDSDMNHILALEMGANDYILKTTPPAVLLARLRLHLRQSQQNSPIEEHSPGTAPARLIRFGTLTIDMLNREVTLADEQIPLSTADFDLLWELASHAGKILNRDALLKTLRGSVMTAWIVVSMLPFRGYAKNCTITRPNLFASKPSVIKDICSPLRPGILTQNEEIVYPVLSSAFCLFPGDDLTGRAGL